MLLSLKSDFIEWDYEPVEGDPFKPEGDKYFENIYEHFERKKFDDFEKFYKTYAYLYTNDVLLILNNLHSEIEKLAEDVYQAGYFLEDNQIPSGSASTIESIINLYSKSIELIRSDCFLDSDFVHQFIDKNKNDPTTT